MLEGWELALTPGVHSQVSGRQLCIINSQELWTYTLFLNVVSKTTTTTTTTPPQQQLPQQQPQPTTTTSPSTTNNNKNNNNNNINTNNNHRLSIPSVPLFASPLRMNPSEQPVSGAAQRRRQRRLRSWLRHERMTVAMALAERTHHSSRGQTIARAGVWRGVVARDERHDLGPPHTPAGALQPCPGSRSGYGGAPCSRSSILSLSADGGTIARHPPFLACSLT